MKNRIFHNWILKLTSVAIALVLWVIIYNINDPAESKRLYNVPVTMLNTEIITDNNQVFHVLNGTDTVRTVTVYATRSVIDDLKEGDINVEADFSKMKMDGTVELKIYSSRHNDSLTFSSSSTELQLLVEDKVDRYLTLSVETLGKPEDGYIIGATSLGQNQIKVSGPESVVNSIAKATAVVDMTGTSESIVTHADIALYDADGKEISRGQLETSVTSVITTVDVLATKSVPIVYETTGEAAEGYVATGEAISEVNELLIAGKENVISAVNEIVVTGEEITIEGATSDVSLTVDIDDYLPAGIFRANKQGNDIIEVTFPIAPIIDKEVTLRAGQVMIENVPEGYEVVHVLRSAEFKVTAQGADYLLENLTSSNIQATFDVEAWMQESGRTSLTNDAIYEVIPVYEVGEGILVTSSESIEIIAKKLED